MARKTQKKRASEEVPTGVVDTAENRVSKRPRQTRPAPLRLLPAEIWLQIFQGLDYATLKTIPLVCHRFNQLLQRTNDKSHSLLDKRLFRDYPEDENQSTHRPQTPVQYPTDIFNPVHPYLQKVLRTTTEFEFTNNGTGALKPLRGFYIRVNQRLSAMDSHRLVHDELKSVAMLKKFIETNAHSKLWLENATSPAVKSLTLFSSRFNIDGFSGFFWNRTKSITLRSEDRGITVFDVMIARILSLVRMQLPTSGMSEDIIRMHYSNSITSILGVVSWLGPYQQKYIQITRQEREALRAWIKSTGLIRKFELGGQTKN